MPERNYLLVIMPSDLDDIEHSLSHIRLWGYGSFQYTAYLTDEDKTFIKLRFPKVEIQAMSKLKQYDKT